jgi:hypothetical protein
LNNTPINDQSPGASTTTSRVVANPRLLYKGQYIAYEKRFNVSGPAREGRRGHYEVTKSDLNRWLKINKIRAIFVTAQLVLYHPGSGFAAWMVTQARANSANYRLANSKKMPPTGKPEGGKRTSNALGGDGDRVAGQSSIDP